MLSIVAVVIVVVALLPVTTGLIAKNRFNHLVERLQQQNPAIKVTSAYHLGWLSSRATVNWTIAMPNTQMPTIENDVIIHHGPLAFYTNDEGQHKFYFGIAVLDFKLPDLLKDAMFAIDFQKKNFSAIICIPFNLHYNTHIHAAVQASLTVAGKPLASINLDNLTLQSNANSDLSSVKADFLMENFNINAESQGYLNIPKITATADLHAEDHVYLGNESFSVPSVEISAASAVQFKADSFTTGFTGQKDKDGVNYEVMANLKNATYNGVSYGPFAFDLEAAHFNFKALSQIQQKLDALKKQMVDNPDSAENSMMDELKPLLPQLIQANTEINLKQLDFTVPYGSYQSNGYIHFNQAGSANGDIVALISKAEMKYHVITDQAFATFIIQSLGNKNNTSATQTFDPQQALSQLVQAGLVHENNGQYELDIMFKQGMPYINNQPFNPGMLQQLENSAASPENTSAQPGMSGQPGISAQPGMPGQQGIPEQQGTATQSMPAQ